eukprot:683198-Prymnesium_polylepis.1
MCPGSVWPRLDRSTGCGRIQGAGGRVDQSPGGADISRRTGGGFGGGGPGRRYHRYEHALVPFRVSDRELTQSCRHLAYFHIVCSALPRAPAHPSGLI